MHDPYASSPRERSSNSPIIDFGSPDYWRDPYSTYRQFRPEHVAVKNTAEVLEILRYRDVEALLRDKRLVAPSVRLLEAQGINDGPFYEWWRLLMFQNEGATHSQLRRTGSRFVSREVLQWAQVRSEEIANELFDNFTPRGYIDVLDDFAHRLPVMVVCDLLKVPPDKYEEVGMWSDDVALGLSISITPSSVHRLNKAVDGLCRTAREAINEARYRPEGPYSNLADRTSHGIAKIELVALISNLLYAGHLTTKNLIGNGILALLQNQDQLERLLACPDLIKQAVEEFLRYDAPVTGVVRQVHADFSLNGIDLHADELVFLSILSANRDPARFSNPDRLDISRKNNTHVSFGWAVHHCLGAPLARVEAAAAISIFLRRCRRPRLEHQELRWRKMTRIRGLESLVVHFDGAE